MKKLMTIISIMFAFSVSQAQITADFTWSDPQCSEGSITFTDASSGNDATSWIWKINGSTESTGSSTFTYTFPLVTTPTDFEVSLYVGDAGFNTDNITKTVTIYPLPTVSLPSIDDVCEGTVVSITENGVEATSWAWTPGSYTTQTINPTMVSTTEYTVVGTDVHGCVNSSSTMVTVYNLPDVDANTDQTICEGSLVSLNGTITGDVITGTWSTSGDGTFDNATALDAVYTPGSNDISTGAVNLTLTSDDPTGPCGAISDDMAVTINTLPPANAGDDIEICHGSSTTIGSAFVAGNTYSWDPIDFLSNPTDSETEASPSSTTTYTVTVSNTATGCTNTDDVTVTVNALPLVYDMTASDNAYCEGSGGVDLYLSGSETGVTYEVYDAIVPTGNQIAGTGASLTWNGIMSGDYTIVATNDVSSCSALMNGNSVIVENALPTADAGIDAEICEGESVQIGSSSQPNCSYLWSPTTGLDNPNNSQPIATPLASTTYLVTVTDDITNCEANDEVDITVNYPFEEVTTTSICAGDSVLWRGSYYFTQDVYTDSYSTVNGCDSTYILNLTVNPLPTNYLVQSIPSNGILEEGNTGEITLSWSDVGINYWVELGTIHVTGDISGTGALLSLGTIYGPGSYDVWSADATTGCELKQGDITFVENTGVPKIVGTPTYGNDQLGFSDGSVEMTLYKSTLDINNNPVIIFVASQFIADGNTEFVDLSAGDYYLKSVSDTIAYPDVIPVWFYDGMSVDSADIITLGETDILAVNINHPMIDDPNGTNTIGGSVDTISNGGKSTTGMPDMVVIVRNEVTGDLVAVTITDADGAYYFGSIPDNKNLQVYVTSFAHQNWTPANITTTENQDYTANFTVNGDAVYPAGSGVEDLTKKLIFSIYPNPASDFVTLDGVPDGAKIQITSITGKTMLLDSRTHHKNLDISNLAPGVYLVVITTENSMGVEKLIIQ